jgi:hypothetical protein
MLAEEALIPPAPIPPLNDEQEERFKTTIAIVDSDRKIWALLWAKKRIATAEMMYFLRDRNT